MNRRRHWVLGALAPLLGVVFLVGGTVQPCLAADGAEGGKAEVVDPRLDPEDDAYMNRQAGALLAEVERTLEQAPPRVPEPRERRLALLVLDGVLHDAYAPNRPAVQRFYQNRIESAVAAMESTKVDEGAVIWKLYNHGFVVRTATVTLAFDLNPGTPGFRLLHPDKTRTNVASSGFPIPDTLMERIVRQCDVLFVSHRHGDHAIPSVAQAFLDQGKPVVAPPDAFEGVDFADKVTRLAREAHTLQTLPIQNGGRELRVAVYPGQQYQDGGPMNNVVVVFTPEGMSFAHNGDQINDPYPEYQKDYEWIDPVHEHFKVDVLMTNCWMNDIYRTVKGFDPKLVVPGHENELGHPVWDRVPYWGDAEYLGLTYPQLLASDYPVLVMTWGESYHYKP